MISVAVGEQDGFGAQRGSCQEVDELLGGISTIYDPTCIALRHDVAVGLVISKDKWCNLKGHEWLLLYTISIMESIVHVET